MYYDGKSSVLWDYWLKLGGHERHLCMINLSWGLKDVRKREGKRPEVV